MDRLADAGEPPGKVVHDRKFDVVHSDALHFYPELVRELGGDPDCLMAEVQFHYAGGERAGSRLSYSSFVQLLGLTAERLKAPDFGLRLAERQRGGKVIGPIGVVMKNSRTVGQALGYCAKHLHAYSLATRIHFIPDRAQQILLVRLEIILDHVLDTRQVTEHALSLANLNVIDITGGAARVRRVYLRHEALQPPDAYRRAFRCEVLFGQECDGIVFSEADLLCKIADPDDQIYEMATSFIEARYPAALPPVHSQVRSLVLRFVGTHDCTHERLASEMNMHPRTLQRRLRAEGASFEAIRDEVRREIALHYLRQPEMPLTRVAEKLGYAEASVLSRSCYRWFGASPVQLRRAGGTLAAPER